jgi:L-methionine (R)-S-oxide reductase
MVMTAQHPTDSDQFVNLLGLSSFLEQQGNLDENLEKLTAMAANIMNAGNCSVMLLDAQDAPGEFRLRVFAAFGQLPKVAYQEAAKVNQGIAGQVAATGQPLLVQDIRDSDYSALARCPDSGSTCFISVPIFISGKVVGVLNTSNPKDQRSLGFGDLNLASFVALLIGKSIQVIQLQNILKSRFTQIALAQEAQDAVGDSCAGPERDPSELVKVLAKTFYKEMSRAGLGRGHIINAATEIISLLNENLQRHDRRSQRESERET